MKSESLRSKNAAELKSELNELLREQFNLRMQKATGQLNRVHLLRNVRRSIARVKTIMAQQEGGK